MRCIHARMQRFQQHLADQTADAGGALGQALAVEASIALVMRLVPGCSTFRAETQRAAYMRAADAANQLLCARGAPESGFVRGDRNASAHGYGEGGIGAAALTESPVNEIWEGPAT